MKVILLLLVALVPVLSIPEDYNYNYGSDSYDYDYSDEALTSKQASGKYPLCCPPGEVWNYHKCTSPSDTAWQPKLQGSSNHQYYLQGFPKCPKGKTHIELYQEDVIFNADQSIILPYYMQLSSLQTPQYCVVKIFDDSSDLCEAQRSKVMVCLGEGLSGIEWTAVGVAHALLLATIVIFLCFQELRCLQGQYMICWLIALLLYHLCLFPGSSIAMDISYVSCIALGAIKYFFYCGVMLWFNVICFDVWRTMKAGQDISGRRRFLLYSAYTWVFGAILTTVVLIQPYLINATIDPTRTASQLMEAYDNQCHLKMEMNIILGLVLIALILISLIFLALATSHIRSYSKFGNGLLRSDALLSLKQAWKLFLIMVAHSIMGIPPSIISDHQFISMVQFILLESVAIWGVFAYRATVISRIYSHLCKGACRRRVADQSAEQEKGQLNPLH